MSPSPRLKDGVIFVYTGRGALVDTQALIRGFISGKMGRSLMSRRGKCQRLSKPFRSGHRLITARLCSFPNVVMTSHQAFFTNEALSQIARVTLENAQHYALEEDFIERSVVC